MREVIIGCCSTNIKELELTGVSWHVDFARDAHQRSAPTSAHKDAWFTVSQTTTLINHRLVHVEILSASLASPCCDGSSGGITLLE